MDFYFWDHMKNLVYSTEIQNEDHLLQRIFNAANEIRNFPNIFQRIRENWVKRCHACIDNNGAHFEHLL